MRPRNKLLRTLGFILVALALASLFTPLLMEHSIAAWLRYEARRSGLVLSFNEIHAPLLRPVEIRDLKIVGAGLDADHFEFDAGRIEAALSLLPAFFNRSEKSHVLSSLHIEHARFFVRGRAPLSAGPIDWAALANLLPDRFDISADQLRFEQAFAHFDFQHMKISASKGKSGILSIGAIEMRAPFLQKRFAEVRGITRWQDDRLTVGSVRLLDALAIDSLVIDFAGLRGGRVGTDLGLSAFGGKIRVNIATERPGKTRIWEVAGSASGISLSQSASALGLIVPVEGLLRGSKFTFRGDPRDFLHASASIWTELTGFSWRERKAEVIMIGANFYDRSVQLQQLYIKQSLNELTLSGESAIGGEWLNPDFRGDITASINDLGQFAQLFGASADAFAGKVAVRGRMHAHERTVDGELALTADALKIFRMPVDSLTARIGLESRRVQVNQLELKRGEDFLRAQGKIDLAEKKTFSLSAESWCAELRDYALEFPLLGTLSGTLSAKISGAGDESSFLSTVSGQTNQLSFSTQTNWRSDSLTVDWLKIKVSAIAEAELSGSIDLTNPKRLRAKFSAVNELRCNGPLVDSICGRGLELHEGEIGLPFSEVTLDGHDLALREASSSIVTRAIRLCGEGDSGEPLQINIPRHVEQPPAPIPSPVLPPP